MYDHCILACLPWLWGRGNQAICFYMFTFFFHIELKELPPQWVAVLYQFQKLISVLIIN